MIRTLLIGLFAVALSTTPSAAQTGPDYVFNVPVRIENAPSLSGHSFGLQCQVQVQGADGHISGYRNTDGMAQHPTYPIGPTGYNGTIQVEVTLPPGVRRADAIRWSCGVNFYTLTNAAGERVPFPSESQYTPLTGQTVARSQLLVQADFPRP